MTFRAELLDELLINYNSPEDLLGEGGILKQLTAALVQRCLKAEMDEHLEQSSAAASPEQPRNRRNGHSKKTIKGEFGTAEIAVPRDRQSGNEPTVVDARQSLKDWMISCCLFWSISAYIQPRRFRAIYLALGKRKRMHGFTASAGFSTRRWAKSSTCPNESPQSWKRC